MEITTTLQLMQKHGHTIFTEDDRPYNLNIVGIRKNLHPDMFNDQLDVFWWYKGNLSKLSFNVTTDPGKYWLLRKGNRLGTAILAEGQYRGAYEIRKHKGKYDALCQKKPVTVWRDDNRDGLMNFNKKQTGLFGINIHGAKFGSQTDRVGAWSAGCTVFQNWQDFDLFMTICKNARQEWGNSFTYTIINHAKTKI